MQGPLAAILDLGFLTLLATSAACAGLRLLPAYAAEPASRIEWLALATALGLGTIALATFGLAEAGLLGLPGIAVLLAACLLAGARDLARRFVAASPPSTAEANAEPRPRLLSWAMDGSLALVLAGTLLTALAPVTDGDALCYHLQVPKVFLAHHAATFDPDLHETAYPLVTEMLYAVALAVRGPVACRLVQWLLGLVFAGCVMGLARPLLGERARWAATIALLTPAISNGMGAPLNDVALAGFGNAALYAWTLWLDRPRARSIALAGALAGLAIGVKYPALLLAGLLLVATWLAGRRQAGSWRYGAKQAALFGLLVVLVGGSWYARAAWLTGNPVHPFFRETFGGAGLAEVLDPARKVMAVTPLNLLAALGTMTLHPARFDSFSHQFGPAFLLFLPAILLLRPPARLWTVLAFGYAFLTLCLTQRQSMRFVLIAIGPLSVGVAWVAAQWPRRTVSVRVLAGLLVLVLAFESTLALARARHGLKVVLGRQTAADYLAKREPTYRVAQWVAGHLPAGAHLVGQDHRGFYFPCTYTMELAHRRRTGLASRGEDPQTIVAHLREAGFTHLLLCPPVPENAVEFDPTLGRKLAPWLQAQSPLYRADIADADGVVRRYAIYDLNTETALAHAPGSVAR